MSIVSAEWRAMRRGLQKRMTISDILALCALVVSILMVPVAAWFSHRSAVKVFKLQEVETRTAQLFDAKCRLDHDLALYGRLVRTIGERDLGVGFNARPLPDPDGFFAKIFDTGIHDLILSDANRLRELGFDVFLETHDSSINEALVMFFLKQNNLTSAKKAELIGRCFLENGVHAKLASISREDIRSFLRSP